MTLQRKIRRFITGTNRFGLLKRHLFLRKREKYFQKCGCLGPIAKNTPFRIRIETTNRCNLRCVTCPLSKKEYNRKFQDMDLTLYRKIIKEVKKFNPSPDIILYMGGEPLMNKDLFKFIKIAKDANLRVQFNTNANMLNEKMSRKIFDSNLDLIEFSFDDVTPKEYESMRKNANYKKVLNNIRLFLNMKKRMKKKRPEVIITGLRLKKGKLSDNLKAFEPRKSFKNLFLGYDIANFEMWYAHKWAASEKKKYSPCSMVYRDFCILCDGKCVPCCYDLEGKMIMGDVKNDSVKKIWNNMKYQKLRQMLNKLEHRKIPLCKGCPL